MDFIHYFNTYLCLFANSSNQQNLDEFFYERKVQYNEHNENLKTYP
jgi:hypothetical protein